MTASATMKKSLTFVDFEGVEKQKHCSQQRDREPRKRESIDDGRRTDGRDSQPAAVFPVTTTSTGKPLPPPSAPFLVPVHSSNPNRIRSGSGSGKSCSGCEVVQSKASKQLTPGQTDYTNEQLGSIYPFTSIYSSTLSRNSIVSGPAAAAAGASIPLPFPVRLSYDLEISPTIDASYNHHQQTCSSSSSAAAIFYTVPKAKSKSTSLDLLGHPSILKSFRQLQEPTRFNTSKHKSTTGGSKLYVPPPHRVLQKKRSETTTASTTVSLRSGDQDQTSGRSDSRRTAFSDFSSVQEKPLAIESPRMPLRVRMRRDEYYYTDTCSKATQTDTKELSDSHRRSSSTSTASVTTRSGRRVDRADTCKIDRSTSPISQVSSAQYLQKLKDLENITGHFVIQRFFTRTDQDFTLWLEEQLSQKAEPPTNPSKSRQSSITSNVPQNFKSDPNDETDLQVPLQEDVEDIPENNLLTDQAGELTVETTATIENQDEEEVIVDETVEQLEVEAEAEDTTEIENTESPRITDVRRPSEIDEIDDGEVQATVTAEEIEEEGAAVQIPEIEPSQELLLVETEIPVQIDEEALVALESQIIAVESTFDTTAAPPNDDPPPDNPEDLIVPILLPKKCQSIDLIPCECFAKLYLHEESIARLLISLSPQALAPHLPVEAQDESEDLLPKSDVPDQIQPIESEDKYEEDINEINATETNNLIISNSKFLSETDTESTPKSKREKSQHRRKIKHSKSFPSQSYYPFEIDVESTITTTTTTTILSIESQSTQQQQCQDFPSFVFPHPNLQMMRKSNSLDSCLGTDFSSIKTRNDSGNSNSGRYEGTTNDNEMDSNIVQETICEVETTLDLKEEMISNSNKDSGLDGYSGSGRSNWFGSTDISSSRQDPDQDGAPQGDGDGTVIIEAENRSQSASVEPDQSNQRQRPDIYSADSDSESEVVMSENYHARSEAETDTEITTDGDAVADDDHRGNGLDGLGHGKNGGRSGDAQDQDQTDVDEDVDDKDIIVDDDLLSRMELDELRLEIDKSSAHSRSHSRSHNSHEFRCRNTCTQTNRSLFSSAWSNATSSSSATTNTSSTGGSYIDLEVVSKKFPVGPPAMGDGGKRNYLPSSSSCLNFVNCNMNFSMRADESKFKMSVSLPAVRGRGDRLQIGGGRQSVQNPRKLQILQGKIGSDKEKSMDKSKQQRERDRDTDRDLPSLWAHVRNRLDSKVSLDVPGSVTSDLAVRGDGISGVSGGAGPSKNGISVSSLREVSHAPRTYGTKGRTDRGHFQRPQHNPQQQHFLQNKIHTNDDRIKRSLERLSKLLDIDKS